MVKTEDVIRYIEQKKHCQLANYQKRILDDIIHGKIADCPRCCGKTFLINGYANYLNHQYDWCKYDSDIKIDDYIFGTEVLCDSPKLLNRKHIKDAFATNYDRARHEYNMDYNSVFTDNLPMMKYLKEE